MLFGDIDGRVGSGPTVIDSFEDGDVSEYATGGDTAWTAVNDSTVAVDGSYYLQHDTANYAAMTSDTLTNLPSGGDTIRCWMRTDSTDTSLYCGIFFGLQDVSTDRDQPGYRIRWEPADQSFYLQVDTDGTGYGTVASDTAVDSFTAGNWYEIEVVWPADPSTTAIEARLFDDQGTQLSSVSGTESTGSYTSGGFGYHHSGNIASGESVRWDYARIIN